MVLIMRVNFRVVIKYDNKSCSRPVFHLISL